MAFWDLVSRLEADAQGRVLAIQREADAEVAAIEAATDREVAAIAARYSDLQRAQRQAVWQRERVTARQSARARQLEARHAQLTRILEKAKAFLPEVAASARYRRALPSHLDEALAYVEGLSPSVRCQSAVVPLLEPVVARHPGAHLIVDESVGPGAIVRAEDGSVTVDQTLQTRLLRMAESHAADLLHGMNDGRR